MAVTVETRHEPEQPLSVVRGPATAKTLPVRIRALFDEFYRGFKSQGELNVVYYPTWSPNSEFEIECGVQVKNGGNSSTPAGTVATATHFGPYDRLVDTHGAIHKWIQENGRKIAGPSWEVYGHWTEDTSKLRTDVFYLLAD